MLVNIGLMEQKTAQKRPRYIPFDIFWVVWWALFLVGLILPTYSSEPFVVFPSVLALAVVWLFGIAQFTQTLLGADLRDLKLTPGGWKVLLKSYEDAGAVFPPEALTEDSAQQAAKEVQRWLPGVARQSVLDWTSLAAIQAVLAGSISIVGLVVGPTLTEVHLWRGWSPVSVLYAASLPTGLSLLLFGLVPFIVSRFLAALRLRSEATLVLSEPTPSDQTAGGVRAAEPVGPVPIESLPKRRRRRARQRTSGNHG